MAEIAAGIFTLALGVVWFVMSFSLDHSNVGGNLGLGPSFFPRIISYLMIVLSIAYLIKLYNLKTKKISIKFSKMSVFMIIGAIVYLLLINITGYVLTTFMYLLFCIFVLGQKKSITDIIATTLIVTCLYSIFHLVLKVPLPNGLLI